MKAFVFICGLLFGVYYLWETSEIARPPGVLAPTPPLQHELSAAAGREKDGFLITPLASFDIHARVIARERYRFGRAAELSPIDLVLGWGPLSDSAVVEKIAFFQGGRAYTWRTEAFPVSRRVIETHSANMHMIPANGEIERQLKSIRTGNMIHARGFLVEASTPDGWRWRSSLTREDTGGGACELVLVDSLLVR